MTSKQIVDVRDYCNTPIVIVSKQGINTPVRRYQTMTMGGRHVNIQTSLPTVIYRHAPSCAGTETMRSTRGLFISTNLMSVILKI